MSDQIQKFYTPDEIVSLLSIDAEHVTAMVTAGKLHAHRFGDQIRIAASDLQEFLDTCRINATNGTLAPATIDRKNCPTFGGQARFTYAGSVTTGTTIQPGTKATYKLHVSADQWQSLLHTFRGKTIRAGSNFATPQPGSLGAWIKEHWQTKMGPAVYVGGILIAEGYATRSKPGWITIHETNQSRQRAR